MKEADPPPTSADDKAPKRTYETAILSFSRHSIPSGTVEHELRTLKGVKKVSVNVIDLNVEVTYDSTQTSSAEIEAFLKGLKRNSP